VTAEQAHKPAGALSRICTQAIGSAGIALSIEHLGYCVRARAGCSHGIGSGVATTRSTRLRWAYQAARPSASAASTVTATTSQGGARQTVSRMNAAKAMAKSAIDATALVHTG